MEISKLQGGETEQSFSHSLFVSVLVCTRDRPKALFRCLESILAQDYPKLEVLVLDNCSARYDICDLLGKHSNDHRLTCFRSERQLGSTGGRNFLMQQARGEIFVLIDDDATFDDHQCLSRITRYFREYTHVGIIATKVIDHSSRPAKLSVPFGRRLRRKRLDLTEKVQLVSWYIGAGHALRREVIEQGGFYSNKFFWGFEELDLSFKAIQNNFAIMYVPDVIVHHWPMTSASASGEKGIKLEFYFFVRNRIWLGYKYFPLPHFLIYLLIWNGFFFIVSVKNLWLGTFFRGISAGICGMKQMRRTPFSKQSITYLKKHFGQYLWY